MYAIRSYYALSLSLNATIWEIGTGTGECALGLVAGIGYNMER